MFDFLKNRKKLKTQQETKQCGTTTSSCVSSKTCNGSEADGKRRRKKIGGIRLSRKKLPSLGSTGGSSVSSGPSVVSDVDKDDKGGELDFEAVSYTAGRWEIHQSVTECVGETPLIQLQRMCAREDVHVYVKCEQMNPGGSLKDRLALGIIEYAEATGQLRPGQTVVDASSGNTGIGLAMVCAAKG
jgi:threonine synthase